MEYIEQSPEDKKKIAELRAKIEAEISSNPVYVKDMTPEEEDEMNSSIDRCIQKCDELIASLDKTNRITKQPT